MLACDAAIIPAVLNAHGQPVDVGRERRLYTGAPRTAIEIRDGGCVWPGCARPTSWTQVHHLIPWCEGGPTDQANGGLFCWLRPPARIDPNRQPRINLTHRPPPPRTDWPPQASPGPAP